MDTYTARSMLLNDSRQATRRVAEPWGETAQRSGGGRRRSPGWIPALWGTLRRFWP